MKSISQVWIGKEEKSRLKFIAARAKFWQNRKSGANWNMWFCAKTNYRTDENGEFQHGIAISRVSNKSHSVSTSSFDGQIQAVFYVLDMARMSKCLLVGLLFGNMGVSIPTYVRNDSSAAVYLVDSANTVTSEKRLNNFPWSNLEELENTDWLSIVYIFREA